MSYVRFGLMILTSTVLMFILMYLNTYALDHLFYSETRLYMALLMGGTMAIVMLAFMLGRYTNRSLNIAIFIGALVVIGVSLWLVRSQVTVSGTSYMRAMIPHHSIAIMTSTRADIRDARVRKLADEIIDAQRREIAEMRYLIADVSAGNTVDSIAEDPPARAGSVEDALNNTLISKLDLSPVSRADANLVLEGQTTCTFERSHGSDPILRVDENGSAASKLNGVVISLAQAGEQAGGRRWTSGGVSITVRSLDDQGDWRSNAELVFSLSQGLEAGYRGFWSCGS